MEDITNDSTEKDKKNPLFDNVEIFECQWFFNSFDQNKRKEIFDIIYDFLFKESEESKKNDSSEAEDNCVKTKDAKYNNKTNKEIITLFMIKGEELNKKLVEYKIKLTIIKKYYLYLEDIENKKLLRISCLRNIRFGDQYEWICNPLYLLYFQYFILKYEKPSSVQDIDDIDEEEEKVDTIDSVSKANQLLKNENLIYIKDYRLQNLDYNQIYEEGNKNSNYSKENIFEYLDYSNKDPKQIIDSELIFNNNYTDVLDFCFESHFDNLIYSFRNEYYFFEYNLIDCLDLYTKKPRFIYLNFSKINKIFNNKYSFKKYLVYWMSKLFPESSEKENIDNKSKFIDFASGVINLIFKNREKYLEIILNKMDEDFSHCKKRILVILNNIDLSNLKWIEKKKFLNLKFLFIFNIQDNFDIFQTYYYDEQRLKKFFLEKEDEIVYKDHIKNTNNEKFYSIFQSKSDYEQSKKELINQMFKDCKITKDLLLNLSLVFNISQLINRINYEKNSIIKLKNDLGIATNISILKRFCPIFNIYASVDSNNIIFKLDDIKFKESFFCEHLKTLYRSNMINYLNINSDDFNLDDIKGPLLEKDIILNILTGQINNDKYNSFRQFKEVKVHSIYCLNYDKEKKYEDNKDKNVVITQESKTAEIYDFAFKINKHTKLGQISIFKDEKDLEKLNKEAIIIDSINFDLKKGKLNIGDINSYSFAIITSISVFLDYIKIDDENKKDHTFFKMKEHCKKNNFEFYIYNYFESNMYIYDEDSKKLVKFNNFFGEVQKLDFFDKNLGIYKYINSSKKKFSIKSTKKNLFYPIENYYQAKIEKKISITYLAKYEFNPSMLGMSTGINNIGLAFWDYKKNNNNNKQFENLEINLNGKTEYFKGDKIIKRKQSEFKKPDKRGIHSMIFSLNEEENNYDEDKKKLLQKKRNGGILYFGNFSEIKNSI